MSTVVADERLVSADSHVHFTDEWVKAPLREGLKLTYSDFIARSELSTTQPNLEMI